MNDEMPGTISRFIAVDWSGARSIAQQRRRIVVADLVASGAEKNISLSDGRTREETAAWIVAQATRTPELVVGLDFSFSFPAWFVRECGAAKIADLWDIAAHRAEAWLAACDPPFWGRPGRTCPAGHRGPDWLGYRACERKSTAGMLPKSTFQVGGAGAVGTGSLRGMQTLLTLRRAGFSIWPFDPPSLPLVLEIYPRSFTGSVLKSSAHAREAYLRTHLAEFPQAVLALASASEDAFDALCSVIAMERQRAEFTRLTQAQNSDALLEGSIFPGRPLTAKC